MKIAIIGKGGSGKSSISWLLASYFSKNKKVLAIDADYNMDLMHNLKAPEEKITFLKSAEKDIYQIFNLPIEENALKITEKFKEEIFTLEPADSFTQKYSYEINKNLKLMVLGDHDYETMYSGRCSHAYAKSIKFYLPYLKLGENQISIIDSVAGTDMLNYGLYLGVDAIFCVVEDTKNSIMVMESSRKIADEYNIPFYALLNKTNGDDLKNIDEIQFVAKFYLDQALSEYEYEKVIEKNLESCKNLEFFINKIESKNNIYRLDHWKEKNKMIKNHN